MPSKKPAKRQSVASRIVDGLFYVMNDRRGFHVDTLDSETRRDFRKAFVQVIEAELKKEKSHARK